MVVKRIRKKGFRGSRYKQKRRTALKKTIRRTIKKMVENKRTFRYFILAYTSASGAKSVDTSSFLRYIVPGTNSYGDASAGIVRMRIGNTIETSRLSYRYAGTWSNGASETSQSLMVRTVIWCPNKGYDIDDCKTFMSTSMLASMTTGNPASVTQPIDYLKVKVLYDKIHSTRNGPNGSPQIQFSWSKKIRHKIEYPGGTDADTDPRNTDYLVTNYYIGTATTTAGTFTTTALLRCVFKDI